MNNRRTTAGMQQQERGQGEPLSTTVLLLCGGQGTRMRPLVTADQPKSLVSFMGRSVIDDLLDLFHDHGIRDVVLTSDHPSFVNHFLHFPRPELSISYQGRQGPWRGTSSCVRDVLEELGNCVSDPYLVVYGDSLLQADLSAMIAFHQKVEADATILYHRPDFSAFLYEPADVPSPPMPQTNYGVMECEDAGIVTHFVEKPCLEEIGRQFRSPCANAAVYAIRKGSLEQLPQMESEDFAFDVFPAMIRKGMRVFGFSVGDGYREDLGTLDRYFQLHMAVLQGTLRLPRVRSPDIGRGRIGAQTEVAVDALVSPPVDVGTRCIIGNRAKIQHSFLGNGVCVADDATVEFSIIHEGVKVGPGARVVRSIVGAHSEIGPNVVVPEATIVGPRSWFGNPRLV